MHVLRPSGRAGDATALRHRVRAATMAAEGVLHDLGVIAMLSSDSQGMGRIGEVVRRTFQNADRDEARARRRAGPRRQRARPPLPRQVTINPAITHGLARHVGSLEAGQLADVVLWRPRVRRVRPELVLKSGFPAWGASGDGNATTTLSEPVLRPPADRRRGGAAAARLSLAFLAGAALDAELPTTRAARARRAAAAT